jgi:hypothetical protein
MGCEWINDGLPFYLEFYCKPDNGCEIQNSDDGRSGVMLQLKLSATATDEHSRAAAQDMATNTSISDVTDSHGTLVLK